MFFIVLIVVLGTTLAATTAKWIINQQKQTTGCASLAEPKNKDTINSKLVKPMALASWPINAIIAAKLLVFFSVFYNSN